MSDSNERILLSPPHVGSADRQALLDAFDSGWIAPVGPDLDAFEAELRDYLGADAVAAVASGTAALHLALLGVGVQPGDSVVVQTATFAATAFAVVHAGATPVFCDVDRRTWSLDPERLHSLLRRRADANALPSAVIAVDLYGMCADYDAIGQVCREFELPLVEDAAEALGSTDTEGRMAGTLADIGVLSFNGNKIMTTSGGGALVGSIDAMERARHLATQAREPVLHYEHERIGYNYRLSNLLAALGRAQLGQLEQRIGRRNAIADRYRLAFPDLEWLTSVANGRSNDWLSVCLLPEGLDPFDVCAQLDAEQIEVRPAWKPMHRQPVFVDADHELRGVADEMFRRGLCLPSGSSMTDAQQTRVIDALSRHFEAAFADGEKVRP